MFCKMCGKPLPSDARFCIYCGEAVTVPMPVEAAPVEEGKSQYHFQPDPEFVWNVEGFPERAAKKTEDVDFSWSKLRDTQRVDFDWNRGDPPKKPSAYTRNTERLSKAEIESALESQKAGGASNAAYTETSGTVTAEASKPAPAAVSRPAQPASEMNAPQTEQVVEDPDEILESIKADTVRADSSISEQEKKIDKFYTFNQKNEEFQKLLDREYEKIRQGRKPELRQTQKIAEMPEVSEAADLSEAARTSDSTDLPEAAQTSKAAVLSSENPKAMPFIKGEELLRENEDLKPFDTRELNKDLMEIALAKSGLDPKNYSVEESPGDRMEVSPPKSQKSGDAARSQGPLAREKKSDFKPMFLVDQEDPSENLPEGSADEGKRNKAAETAAQELPWINKNIDWEKKRELDSLWGTIEIQGFPDPKKAQPQNAQNAQPEDAQPESVAAEKVSAGEARTEGAQPGTHSPEGAQPEVASGIDAVSASTEAGAWQLDIEDEEERGGASFIVKFLIAILVVLLIAEVSILGIRYFAPDTAAGTFVEEKLGIATEWVQRLMPSDASDAEQDVDSTDSTDSQNAATE